MKTPKILIFLFIFFSLFSSLVAQDWAWAQHFGNTGNESASDMVELADENLLFTGSFSETIAINGQSFTSIGKEDIYLQKTDHEGRLIWIQVAGGDDIDETHGLGTDQEGNIYWTGTYWKSINFDGQTLSSGSGAKAIFLAKYNPDGQVIWAKTFTASGLKAVNDMAVDDQGNVFLTGYFGGDFNLPDTVLSAKGEADFYALKLNTNGDFEWVTVGGESGFIRGTNIQLNRTGEVVISGYYKGQIALTGDTIQTNTSDNDVFVAQLRSDGTPLWLRKAGGVHEDYSTGLAVDESRNIYVCGYYYGVLNLGNGVEVQASGFNDNFFMLKYGPDGTPLWAKTFGGDGLAHAVDIQYQDGELLLGAYFKEAFIINTMTLNADTDFDSFILNFQAEQGDFNWVRQISSTGFVLIDKIKFIGSNSFMTIGSFTNTSTFDNIELTAGGGFDAFFAKGNRFTTSVGSPEIALEEASLYPNPAKDRIFIKSNLTEYRLELFDRAGRKLQVLDSTNSVDISTYLPGAYFLILYTDSRRQILPFIKY